MESATPDEVPAGTPELASIGKRIEVLRIERGISKQQLAKAAGISRQQLWRVLAGKSELTSSLRERLAMVLRTDVSVLRDDDAAPNARGSLAGWLRDGRSSASTTVAAIADQRGNPSPLVPPAPPATFAEFAAAPSLLRDLVATLPACDAGAALKRALLDAVEHIALARGVALDPAFFELRRTLAARDA